MSFNPDEHLIPDIQKTRCPHCGELTTRRWRFTTYFANRIRTYKFECVLCGKASYLPPKKVSFLTIVINTIAIILTAAFCIVFYSSKWSVRIWLLIGLLAVGFLINYLRNKFKILGWCARVTSQDGTPAPGRRIKLSVTSDAKRLKKIKEFAIYDIVPADDHQGGVIYAQCEEITEFYATLRVIKCKGYDAPMGDDVKILVGKKQIEAKVTEETEPPSP